MVTKSSAKLKKLGKVQKEEKRMFQRIEERMHTCPALRVDKKSKSQSYLNYYALALAVIA